MFDVPALAHLMRAYFHQDWDMYGDEWDVIDVYVRDEAQQTGALIGDIDATLAAFHDETELRAFLLDDLGVCYLADADGGTYRDWLTQIAARVRAATGQR